MCVCVCVLLGVCSVGCGCAFWVFFEGCFLSVLGGGVFWGVFVRRGCFFGEGVDNEVFSSLVWEREGGWLFVGGVFWEVEVFRWGGEKGCFFLWMRRIFLEGGGRGFVAAMSAEWMQTVMTQRQQLVGVVGQLPSGSSISRCSGSSKPAS